MHYASFEQFLAVSRGLQPITIFGYVGSVKRMQKALGENPGAEQMTEYIFNLYTSPASYAHKTNTALALERWTEYKGFPMSFGRQKKPRPIIKDTLSEAEITRLIFSARNSREKAIISLLAYSGIRNLEICNLKVKDFLWSQNAVRVIRGKGLKDGISEITPECSKMVMEYLADFPRNQESYLFTTLKRGAVLNPRDVRKLVKKAARRGQIAKRVYPHLLRHSLAANAILRGIDIISLKNQLRHSWLETTLHYANSIVFVEKNTYQKFAPSYC